MNTIKRPGRGESEEDLLKFQEEYFASKQQPSVTVKKDEKKDGKNEEKNKRDVVVLEDDDIPANITSARRSDLSFKKSAKRFQINDTDLDAAKKLDEKEKEHISTILSNIQEHDVSSFGQFKADFYKTGFPMSPSLDQNISKVNSQSTKKSLFAQQFHSFSKKGTLGKAPIILEPNIQRDIVSSNLEVNNTPTSSKQYTKNEMHSKTLSFLPNQDREAIHMENLNRLNEMSQAEIFEEKAKLLNSLDPNVVSFLRSKGEANASINLNTMVNNSNEEKASTSTNSTKEEIPPSTFVKKVSFDPIPKGLDSVETINPHKQFQIKKDYVHMSEDYIEKEKIAWMEDLPKVKLSKSDCLPRFHFEGQLLQPDEEIPLSAGLHHHGEEPSAPGYSLEELFHMARSKFPKQRVFALQTLGRIIKKYHEHTYHGQLSTDLLTQCLDAGLLFILRWSLDEHAEQIYSAAVAALAYIVYVESDQDVVDSMLFTQDGLIIPSLCTYYKKKKEDMTQEELEEERDLTDAEIISLDVVKGLLQIQILPRLRYVMEICQPSDVAMKNCLKIIIRIIQHNKECTFHLFKNTPFIDLIMKIVKTKTAGNEDSLIYALKVIKYICIAGKNMASKLVASNSFEDVITGNLSSINTKAEVLIETCLIWKILMSYNITTGLVRDVYSAVMSQLQNAMTSYKNTDDRKLAALVHVIIAITKSSVFGEFNWSIVDGLQQIVFNCLTILQNDLTENKKITHPSFTDAVLQCCCTYFVTKNSRVSDVSPVDLLDDVEQFWNRHLQVIVDSPLLYKLLDELSIFSDFKYSQSELEQVSRFKSPANLPNYGTYCLYDRQPLSLKQDSPVALTLTLLHLSVELMKINKKLIPKGLAITMAPETLAYLKFMNESKLLSRASVLVTTRIELLLLSNLFEVFYLTGCSLGFAKYGLEVLNLYQEVAFKILSLFHPADEQHAIKLMKQIIFNTKMFCKQSYMLWLPEHYKGNGEEIVKTQLNLCRSDLQSAGSIYKTVLFGSKFDEKSEVDSFMTPSRQTSCIPQDWMFYPLVELYDMSLRIEQSGGMIKQASEDTINYTKKCLQFLLLVELTRSSLFANIEETLRLTRFLCVFLTEGELYKESILMDLVTSLTLIYSSQSFQCYLDFEKKIPGITSFYDFYCSLIQQYLASSFGDYNFANLLLLPMKLTHSVKYRRAIWSEFDDMLRLFPLPLDQVMCDIKHFLAAEIEDEELVTLYYQALIKGKVKPTWCPIFYVISVHHVNQYIFKNTDEVLNVGAFIKFVWKHCINSISKEVYLCILRMHKDTSSVMKMVETVSTKTQKRYEMLQQITALPDGNLKDDIITYQSFDIHCENGILRFKVLPPSRELMIRHMQENT